MTIKRMTKADHPQSFGAFKPVGHVVVALPDDECAARAAQELRASGFAAEDILAYSAADDAAHERVAGVVRTHGALIAEKYHRLAIEDLI